VPPQTRGGGSGGGQGGARVDCASRLSLHKSHEFASVVANQFKLPALAARIARLAAVKDFGEDAALAAGAPRRRAVVRLVIMATASSSYRGAAAASAAAAAAAVAPPPPPRVGVVDDKDEDAPVGVRRILPRAPTAAAPAPAAGQARGRQEGGRQRQGWRRHGAGLHNCLALCSVGQGQGEHVVVGRPRGGRGGRLGSALQLPCF